MASRWMQPKLDKMRRDRRPAEPGKARSWMADKIALRATTEQLLESYKGEIIRGETGRPLPMIGKQRRQYITQTYGNGKRKWLGAALGFGQ